ncbi:MAG TPA: hemerythrin domain-containing protein [Actinospica sp.]|jgi:hypothetical protein|nr:hemerythrin domain-containing protein [Actinospica sp.]
MTQVRQECQEPQSRQNRLRAADLPAGSVVAVLLDQHAKIRELFARTAAARGEARRRAFDELRELLAVHEAGEKSIVRPVSERALGGVADARRQEEKRVASALAELARLDVDCGEFAAGLGELEREVAEHADAEESEEFPFILAAVAREKQVAMGSRLLDVQRASPVSPGAGRAANGTPPR